MTKKKNESIKGSKFIYSYAVYFGSNGTVQNLENFFSVRKDKLIKFSEYPKMN